MIIKRFGTIIYKNKKIVGVCKISMLIVYNNNVTKSDKNKKRCLYVVKKKEKEFNFFNFRNCPTNYRTQRV